MAGNPVLGLRAAGACVAVTALCLVATAFIPATAAPAKRLLLSAGVLVVAGGVFWFFT